MHLLWSHGLGGEIMSSSDFLGCVARSARGAYALLEVFAATLPARRVFLGAPLPAVPDVPGIRAPPAVVDAVPVLEVAPVYALVVVAWLGGRNNV